MKHRLEFYHEEKVSCVVSVIFHLGQPQTMLIQLFHETFILLHKIPVWRQERGYSNATSTFVTNGDEFMNTLNKTYKSNPNFQVSLLVSLVHIFMSKINGEINPAILVKKMNSFVASESIYRSTFNLVSANLLGPSLHTVQRINANSRGPAIIHCDMNIIKEREKKIITMKKEDLTKANGKYDPVVTVAIGFDGTKVPQFLKVDHAQKAIVGGVFPDHFINVDDKTEEELKTLLDTKSSIVRTKEVKICVMSVQKPGVDKIPNYSLRSFLQGINAR